MKAAECIYILSFFLKNKTTDFTRLIEEEGSLFTDTIVKAMTHMNIYSAIEFVRLTKLAFTFEIDEREVWKNLLVKGNLLLSNANELEEALPHISLVLKMFISIPFTDMSS